MIAYIRRSNDIMTDQTRSSIWLVDADGANHRPLLDGDAQTQSPRWSPDGERLAYVQSGENGASIRIHGPSGGRELTTVQGGVTNLSWSPDGRRLAFASFVPEDALTPAPLPEQPEGADWAAAATVEDRLMFRFDGTGSLPRGSQQIFILDPETGNTRQLTEGEPGASGDFTWAADSSAIVFSADRRPDAGSLAPDTELHLVSLRDGEITRLTDRRGPDGSPRSAPDGSRLAWLGYDDNRMGYHNVELYVGGVDGSAPQSLTAGLDRSVGSPVWAEDGSGLYIQYDDHGQTRVAFVSLDGEITIRADGLIGATFGRPYTGGSYSVAEDGTVAAMTGSPVRPSDISVFPPGGHARQVTALNEDLLATRSLSMAEDIRWASPHDGTEIQGWVLYPPDFDPSEKWPLLLEIHGGPFSAYGPSFSAELQLMAAAGYVVLYTNPRGSTSYGYDFANLIHHDYPGNDYDDLMGGVDAVIERGFIDEDRLFVTGGSGGGVLTAWIIGNTDRFAAAAVVKPVINWSSFVLHADLPQFFSRYWFAAPPWEAPEEYWRRSPLSLVGDVDTPTLMMVGGADVRTPRSETEQYYSALQLEGVPTRLVVIPDAFHGISNSRPSRLLSKVAEILRWFETHDPQSTGSPTVTGAE